MSPEAGATKASSPQPLPFEILVCGLPVSCLLQPAPYARTAVQDVDHEQRSQDGEYHDDDLDARQAYGRRELLVEPVDGEGKAWTTSKRVKLD
jgi:hypothetical protein